MSVASWARGHGVAHALFAELHRFCEQQGYERIVLSTSNLQRAAHDRLYPGIGFERVHRRPILGKVGVSYFAMPVATPCGG